MKQLRRAVVAVVVATIVGAAVRLRGRGGKPPKGPGWEPVAPDPSK